MIWEECKVKVGIDERRIGVMEYWSNGVALIVGLEPKRSSLTAENAERTQREAGGWANGRAHLSGGDQRFPKFHSLSSLRQKRWPCQPVTTRLDFLAYVSGCKQTQRGREFP